MLDQILPAVVAGRLIVWTEATPTEHRAPAAAASDAARPVRSRASRAAVPRGDVGAGAAPGAAGWRTRRELKVDPDCAPVALSSARQYLSAANFPGSAIDLIKLTANARQERHARSRPRRDRDPVAAHRPAGLDPRQQGARRPGRDPRLLRGPRDRPGRGGRSDRRSHRHAQGGAERSRQADRRVPVRRPHGHGQDRARQDGRNICSARSTA